MSTALSYNDEDWYVNVVEPLPDCPSIEAAYDIATKLTEHVNWRSSDFPKKVKFAFVGDTKEPAATGDVYKARLGLFIMKLTVIETMSTQEKMTWTTCAEGFCGLMRSHNCFSFFVKDGTIYGKAQEFNLKLSRGSFLLPAKSHIENEHKTMFEELNALFKK